MRNSSLGSKLSGRFSIPDKKDLIVHFLGWQQINQDGCMSFSLSYNLSIKESEWKSCIEANARIARTARAMQNNTDERFYNVQCIKSPRSHNLPESHTSQFGNQSDIANKYTSHDLAMLACVGKFNGWYTRN
jgi:hypothetical protein